MSSNFGVGILGMGSFLPDKVLSNQDLEKMVETSDEWIVKRTGISERRILEKDEPAYKMGVEAAKRALEDAGLTSEDIDLIICATVSADYVYPQTACLIQAGIGAKRAAAFDINVACSGFVYGITIAQQFISTGCYKKVLVVGCEGISRTVDWEDRSTCILFGDGAGAAVLGQVEEGYGILSTNLGADGESGKNVTLPCFFLDEEDLSLRVHENKNVIWMNGDEVFKFAVRIMARASEEVIEKAGLEANDIKFFIPHQANKRIIDGALKRLGVKADRTHSIIQKYGNISSASIPVALEEAVKEGKIRKGDNFVVVGFGGGLTWASAVIKWSK